ncbi:MAG: M48 family metalloprotease [Coriobacteriia bacterium]|nr:M48 family metalloprotease [Coriobacteriia bacterium]
MTPVELPEGVRRARIEPLWARVDRNRVKFALFIVAYLASIAGSAALVAAAVGSLFGVFAIGSAGSVAPLADLGLIVGASSLVALLAGAVWVTVALVRSEKRLLGKLGAVLTPTGSYSTTKYALKDMALAAGFPHAPPLWVIPDCARVNAFAVGRTPRTAVMGVTQGFAERLSPEDQRAVFANLMARLTNGDVRWATAVSSLVGPIWRLREGDLRRDSDELPGTREGSDTTEEEDARLRRSGDAMVGALLYFLLYVLVIVITELLLAGHQRSTMLTAEKADAEGMLLLKDPREMLRALETVLQADNTVPTAGEAHSALFYCWAGFGYAPEDDPEFERLSRLREVLGAEGLAAPPVRSGAGGLLEPPAPRIERGTGGPS